MLCRKFYSEYHHYCDITCTQNNVTQCSILPTPEVSFTTRQVLNNIGSDEKNKQVQHSNLFKCQTFFTFQHIIHIHLSTYPTYQQLSECLVQKNNADCSQVSTPQQHFLNYEQIPTTNVLVLFI